MMERGGGSPESLVPPGFRFHPTDEELVGYYLRKKVASQKIDLDVIRDVDLYKIEPWDLQDKCRIGYEEQKEWYFFSHKDKKYPSGTRTNRATVAGFWKATGRDKAVHTGTKLIGMRKTLVFYKGRAPNGQKTEWIMHEYRLESLDDAPPQEEGWVVCRAFKKRHQMKTTGVQSMWASTFYNCDNEPSSCPIVGSINVDEMICKQEIYQNRHNDAHHFVQLPQLEISPSLPPGKSMAIEMEINKSDTTNNKGEDDQSSMGKRMKEVMDWRDLDKFVASQLSHGDGEDELCVGPGLESHVEEAGTSRVGEMSTIDFDNIGICIFNK